MTRFLLPVTSVHLAAAACDYLQGRLTDGDEAVVLAVGAGEATRDAGDAANVASVRLGSAVVETATREGDLATVVLEAAEEFGVDEVVVGVRTGEAGGLDDAVGRVVGTADRPVVAVPVPEP